MPRGGIRNCRETESVRKAMDNDSRQRHHSHRAGGTARALSRAGDQTERPRAKRQSQHNRASGLFLRATVRGADKELGQRASHHTIRCK